MTIRSLGYDGSIGEREWAMIAPAIGSPPTTVGAADFQVTATSGLQVRVAPGAAAGWGIYDVSDAAETITIEAATSAVRYDAVVLRRDWSGTSTTPTGGSTGGRSFIAVVKGGSSPVIPSLNTNGGVLADQALALVQVSPGASTVLVSADLRASFAPAAVVRSPLAMTGPLGARYVLAPTGKRYVVGLTAAGTAQAMEEWEPDAPTLPNVPRVRGRHRDRVQRDRYRVHRPQPRVRPGALLGELPQHRRVDPRHTERRVPDRRRLRESGAPRR